MTPNCSTPLFCTRLTPRQGNRVSLTMATRFTQESSSFQAFKQKLQEPQWKKSHKHHLQRKNSRRKYALTELAQVLPS